MGSFLDDFKPTGKIKEDEDGRVFNEYKNQEGEYAYTYVSQKNKTYWFINVSLAPDDNGRMDYVAWKPIPWDEWYINEDGTIRISENDMIRGWEAYVRQQTKRLPSYGLKGV